MKNIISIITVLIGVILAMALFFTILGSNQIMSLFTSKIFQCFSGLVLIILIATVSATVVQLLTSMIMHFFWVSSLELYKELLLTNIIVLVLAVFFYISILTSGMM